MSYSNKKSFPTSNTATADFIPPIFERSSDWPPSLTKKLITICEDIIIFFAFPRSFTIKYNKPIQELIKEAKESVERELETIKSIIESLKLEEEKIKKGINK